MPSFGAAAWSLAAALLLGPTPSLAVTVTPIQKVIQLLDGMIAKGQEEKHLEEVEFAKFQQWCDGVRAEKTKSIKEGASQILQLEADITKASTDATALAGEVKELEGAVAKAEKELGTATALRKAEKADYDAQHADFSDSIDACERAIQVLKARSKDVPQSLLQVRKLPLVPERAKSLLASFLSLHGQQGPPQANAYESQSGSVIDMLEKLTGRFKEELLALQKAEMNARSNFEMLSQQLHDNIQYDGKSISDKTEAKAQKLEIAAKATGDLNVVTKGKAEDEQALEDTTAECHLRSEEFEKNQVLRAEEVKAIKGAMDILSSESVAGAGEKHLPALLQGRRKPKVLAQLHSTQEPGTAVKAKAAAYLQAKAHKMGSRYLAVMAQHAADDPFEKVKKMIKDLIVRLMEEANSEADHHAFCSTELSTNKLTREDKAAEVEKLTASVDKMTAEIGELATQIAQLSDAIAEISAQQSEGTKLRAEEKSANEQVLADANGAQGAVEKAIQLLRDFYGKQTAAAAMIQQAQKEPYTGMGDASTGVLGLLDVILSDFARLETETSAAEDQAASAFEKFMAESTQDKEVKEMELSHNRDRKQGTEEQLRTDQKELKLTQEELDKALDYYDKLKEDCLETGLSYEDRVRMRQEEIQSLKEALRILTGEDIA